jgi:hypothetical protein
MIRQLHHVCILTADVERLSVQLTGLLGLDPSPTPRVVSAEPLELRTVMLPVGNGTFLQLLEPRRGPGVAELASGGEGALYEVAFEVDRAEDAARAVESLGVVPEDMAGSRLPGGYATAGSGSRFLYLPRGATSGVRIELIEPVR